MVTGYKKQTIVTITAFAASATTKSQINIKCTTTNNESEDSTNKTGNTTTNSAIDAGAVPEQQKVDTHTQKL